MSAHPKTLGDRILVKPLTREETTKSGIVLPDTAKERPQEGTVIAVGSGERLESGELRPLDVKEGQRVLFARYSGTEIKLESDDYLFLRESDVLAIVEG
jgi:chaperonin GroES